jgi:hypothetical protein
MEAARLRRFLTVMTNNEVGSEIKSRFYGCMRNAFSAGANVLTAIDFALMVSLYERSQRPQRNFPHRDGRP